MDLAVSKQFKYDFQASSLIIIPLIKTNIERKGRAKETEAGKKPIVVIMNKPNRLSFIDKLHLQC